MKNTCQRGRATGGMPQLCFATFELAYEDVAGMKHETVVVFETTTESVDNSGVGVKFLANLVHTEFRVRR